MGHFVGHKKGQNCNADCEKVMIENGNIPCLPTPDELLNINLHDSASAGESPSSVVNSEGRRLAVRGRPGRKCPDYGDGISGGITATARQSVLLENEYGDDVSCVVKKRDDAGSVVPVNF